MSEKFQNAFRASENGRTVLIEARVLKALGSPETLSFRSLSPGCLLWRGGEGDLKIELTARSGAGRVFSRALASLINEWDGMSSTTIRSSKQGLAVAVVARGFDPVAKPEPRVASGSISTRKPYWWREVKPDFPQDDLYQGMSGVSIDELCILLKTEDQPLHYEELKELLKNPKFEIPERMLFIRFSGPLNMIGRRIFTEETCEFYFTKKDWDRLLDLCHQQKEKIDIDEQALIHNVNYFSMLVALANARHYIETGETVTVGPPALSLEETK